METFIKNRDFVKEIRANVESLMNLQEPENRIAIFGRNSVRPESLFELILSIPQMATEQENFIGVVWDKFDLLKTPEILQVVSGSEKYYYYYFNNFFYHRKTISENVFSITLLRQMIRGI